MRIALPTHEHFVPLLVALGASVDEPGRSAFPSRASPMAHSPSDRSNSVKMALRAQPTRSLGPSSLLLCDCSRIAKRIAREVLKAKHAREIPEAGADLPPRGSTRASTRPTGSSPRITPRILPPTITGKAAIMMTRHLDDDESELITLVSVMAPVSTDVTEYTRVVSLAEVKKLDGYEQISKTTTKCLGVDGVEIVSTWKPGTTVYRRRWCGFLRNGHGYAFAYTLPADAAESDEPLLRAIVEESPGSTSSRPFVACFTPGDSPCT